MGPFSPTWRIYLSGFYSRSTGFNPGGGGGVFGVRSGRCFCGNALRQLTGGLASHLEPMEEFLKSLYLKVEARLEFADDGIPALDQAKFEEEVSGVRVELQKLLDSYQQGKVLREGLTVALVGPPNVGKSSLLNTLLGTQRAIVTPLAGTTRDVVEGDIRLKGVRVRFFDTAGLRDTENVVEVEGIRRSRQVMEEADLIFWLIDASNPAESLAELKPLRCPLIGLVHLQQSRPRH